MPTLANESAEGRMIGAGPDEAGDFGPCGGAFIAETPIGPVKGLGEAYVRYRRDPDFLAEFEAIPTAVSALVAEMRSAMDGAT